MKKFGTLEWVCLILILIGGVNWALVGLGGINLVGLVLGGGMSWLARLVYILIGLSAVYLIYFFFIKKDII